MWRLIVRSTSHSALPRSTIRDLVLLKIAAGGPQDIADAAELATYDPGVEDHLRAISDGLPSELSAAIARFIESF